MKTIYFMLLSTCFCSFALAQELRTNFSEENQTYGGDVHLKSSYARIIEAGTIAKTFEIECLEDGAYYMDAWILPPSTDKGFPEYKVEIKRHSYYTNNHGKNNKIAKDENNIKS